jgi:DNA-binding XRE family transcriptional regulator
MSIKCDCGGTMKKAKLTDFDLEPYLGLKVKATSVQGLRCDKCGWETLGGEEINSALHRVAGILLRQEERLETDRARYLRKYLGATQEGLAKRMSVTRKTVNQWETTGDISPQNDLVLRALVYAQLTAAMRPEAAVLDHVRTSPPKSRPRPLVVEHLGKAA